MKDAFFRSPVEHTDGLNNRSLCGFGVLRIDRSPRFGDESTRATTINTITNAALLVLPVSLDLRFNVGQSRSSKKCPAFPIRKSKCRARFYPKGADLSSVGQIRTLSRSASGLLILESS